MDTMAFTTTVLVLMAASIPVESDNFTNYTPHITHWPMEGNITTTTFVLDQPRGNFTDVGEDDRIWLLVAHSGASNQFALPENPQNLSYQSFNKHFYYMTLDTAVVNYQIAASPDEITVLRVGSETSCIRNTSRPDCNGPLLDAGPYRVQFIAIRRNGHMLQSQWSEEITLIQGRDYNTITTSPRRRSRGTIVIVSLLPILFTILLVSFITALVYKYSEICGKANTMSLRDSTVMTRYTAHQACNDPTFQS